MIAILDALHPGAFVDVVAVATCTMPAGASAREIASILAPALAIAWIRAVSGSVVPSIAARVVFFGVQVVPLVLAHEPKYSGAVAIGGAGMAVLSLAGIAAVGKRS